MGGGGGCVSEEFGVLRGSSLSPVVMLDESDGAVSGCGGSFASDRGLGGSGGGIGLVADGASGMSWEFCCATRAPVRNNVNPRTSAALIFVAIPASPYLALELSLSPVLPAYHSFTRQKPLHWVPPDPSHFSGTSDAETSGFGASNHYSLLQDRLAKFGDKNSDD